MHMKKILLPIFGLSLVLLLAGWGSRGHKRISQNASYAYPSELLYLVPSWTTFVTNHSSDADYRKDQDPNESPRHYIDIDNYPEFLQQGAIHHTYDSVVARHGLPFVIDQGTLPWATLRSFDSLISCFQRGDWDRSALYAADLAHYVGDGHMPLHITRNYDGQYTGQNGIHSRYETTLIKKYEAQLVYTSDTAALIDDPVAYVFGYLYHNYAYTDSILAADTFARNQAGSVSSDLYYSHLWNKSRNFTIDLMNRSSHALASLIYTAWVRAGSVRMYPTLVPESENRNSLLALNVYPNPAGDGTDIRIAFPESLQAGSIDIVDYTGRPVYSEMFRTNDPAAAIRLESGSLTPGVYMCILRSGNVRLVRKLVVLH